jgi:hypothetical protein
MKKYLVFTVLLIAAAYIHAQWDDGILMDVQEVDIAKMKAGKMSGAEAVMKVMEQYANSRYRFTFVSNNYLIPAEQEKNLNLGKTRFTIAVAGYPALNNLLYVQVFFDKSFFFVVLTKNETDMKRSDDVQIIKLNDEKGNAVRRNNVRDTIQRNNIIPLGIDTGGTVK